MRTTGAEKPMTEELGLTWIWKDVQSVTRLSRGRARLAASLSVFLPSGKGGAQGKYFVDRRTGGMWLR